MEGNSQPSIQDFVAFLRSASTPEDQIPKFQKVAEQLLLAMAAQDLLRVSAEQMNGWLESLRARNPTEAQLALVARGLAAIRAFQRRRSAGREVEGLGASCRRQPRLRLPAARQLREGDSPLQGNDDWQPLERAELHESGQVPRSGRPGRRGEGHLAVRPRRSAESLLVDDSPGSGHVLSLSERRSSLAGG